MDLIITKKKIFRFSFVYLFIYLLFGCYFALNSLVVVVDTNTKIYNSFIILFVFFRFFTINIPDLLLLILFFLNWFGFSANAGIDLKKYTLQISLNIYYPLCYLFVYQNVCFILYFYLHLFLFKKNFFIFKCSSILVRLIN